MDPVRKALWFVESHFQDSITLEDIAGACEVSPFHLTRAFATSTGFSLMRYVRARRLTASARRLANGATDILAVALDAGYGSHEAFTRAFRDHFGATPEHVRARGCLDQLSLVEPIAMNSIHPTKLEAPRYETVDNLVLAGIQERHDCADPSAIPDQWQRFTPLLGHVPGQVGAHAYGAVHNFDSEGKYDYLTGVQVRDSANVPPDLTTLRVPAAQYVVFRHREHVADVRSTISTIWSDWFPASCHRALEAPMLERYGPEFDPRTGRGGFEIWIAIES
jgi:AraC family transcriptional regulator